MPFLEVNGVKLYYELTGNRGPCLVLVHGSWGDHHNWDEVLPSLSGSFRVLTYDRRGHSQSERPPGQGRIEEDVHDLSQLIERLGLGPAHIAGNSFGATIVLRTAMAHPAVFRSMVIHEPPLLELLRSDAEGQRLLAEATSGVSDVIKQLVSGDMAGGARSFVEEVAFGPGAWDQLPPQVQQTFIFNAPTFLDETQDADAFKIHVASLREVKVATLLTQGEKSYPWFPRIVSALAASLPNCEQKTIAGAGHVPHLTHPDQYVEIVTDFIKHQR